MRILPSASGFRPRRLPWLSLVVLVGLLAIAMPTRATAATNQLDFSPGSATIAAGGTVNVDITISNVTNLGGYNLHLQFNPAVVHLTSLVDAGFVTNNPTNVVVCNTATIDNTAGTATDSCATAPFPPPGPGVSATAPVALMHASFKGVGSGTSSLTLNGTNLLDPSGIQLTPAPTLGTGSITVSGASVGGLAQMPDVGALRSSTASTGGGDQARLFVLAGIAIAILVSAAAGVAWRRARER
jgi:hypothetical protein